MRTLICIFRLATLLLALVRLDCGFAQLAPVTERQWQSELVATWLVTVADDSRPRILRIRGVVQGADGAWQLDATYGWQGSKGAQVQGEIVPSDGTRQLELQTSADSKIIARQAADGSFSGTMTVKNGALRPVRLERMAGTASITGATAQMQPPAIHMVVMGGNDCPACVTWRALELPKLQQTQAFKSIRYSYVTKAVQSPVPMLVFLPDEVKPYKEQLDEAGSRRKGSPQVAIIVNEKIYDYYFGTRTAEEIEKMILAVQGVGKYPFRRCLKINLSRQCEIPA